MFKQAQLASLKLRLALPPPESLRTSSAVIEEILSSSHLTHVSERNTIKDTNKYFVISLFRSHSIIIPY